MSIFQSIVYPSERRALCPGLSSRYEPFCGVVRGEHGDDAFNAQSSVKLGAPVVAGVTHNKWTDSAGSLVLILTLFGLMFMFPGGW